MTAVPGATAAALATKAMPTSSPNAGVGPGDRSARLSVGPRLKPGVGVGVQSGVSHAQRHPPIPTVQVISQAPFPTHDDADDRAARYAGKGRVIAKDQRAFVRRGLKVVVGYAPAAQVYPAGPRHPQLEPLSHSIVAKEHVARTGRVVVERLKARRDCLRGIERQRDDRGLREVGRLPSGKAVARRGRGRDLDGDGLKVDALPGQIWE